MSAYWNYIVLPFSEYRIFRRVPKADNERSTPLNNSGKEFFVSKFRSDLLFFSCMRLLTEHINTVPSISNMQNTCMADLVKKKCVKFFLFLVKVKKDTN